jgi:hypothetical protein
MEREFRPPAEAETSLPPTIFKQFQTEIRVRVNTCTPYQSTVSRLSATAIYKNFTVLIVTAWDE